VANVARLNAANLASLAAAPAPPQKVRLETNGLANDSTLVWDAPADRRATSYVVLWRATAAADWENSQLVGKAVKATISASKDNVIFAVQTVDDASHRSLPIVPVPER